MLKKNPLVSIIMSVHNSEETIERCIKSILAQTYKNFEFIIQGDARSIRRHNIRGQKIGKIDISNQGSTSQINTQNFRISKRNVIE